MERNNKIRCDICNKEISKSNWSKHIKTKKHKRNNDKIQKHCGICNILVLENEFYHHIKSNLHKSNTKLIKDEINNIQKYCGNCKILVFKKQWNDHLKSINHKNNIKLFQDKLKQKVRSFNIEKQRKRHFNDLDFETDDYIVKKSEEVLERCFLTLRITPKNDISSIQILMEELPELMFERMKYSYKMSNNKLYPDLAELSNENLKPEFENGLYENPQSSTSESGAAPPFRTISFYRRQQKERLQSTESSPHTIVIGAIKKKVEDDNKEKIMQEMKRKLSKIKEDIGHHECHDTD